MTDIEPINQLTSTYSSDDLRALLDGEGPFLTVMVPSPSEFADSAGRLDVRWRNARRDVADAWPSDLLDALDSTIDGLSHDLGEALVVIQRADGHTLVEPLLIGLANRSAEVADLPDLVAVIENRQRTLPHVLVRTDRAGADVIGFDGGLVVDADLVEGDTVHIHRGHPGGWSQRRFQQRAENTWEQNADSVADRVRQMIDEIDPVLVVVAGEVRARSLVLDALDGVDVRVEGIDAGDDDGIADATVRLVDDQHARYQRHTLERLRGSDLAVTGADTVLDALGEGRVDTLLVSNARRTAGDEPDTTADRAMAGALTTSAHIVVVPTVPELDHGVAAIARW